MKSNLILPILTVGALTVKAQLEDHKGKGLLRRAIEPNTMDPVRLSVLSVLKTAEPTGRDLSFPTGSFEPDWFQKLPQDVKDLLPSLYPATATAVAATPASSMALASQSIVSVMFSAVTMSPSSTALTTSNTDAPSSMAGMKQNATQTIVPANSTSPTRPSGSALLLPSGSFSTGTKTAVRLEALTAIAWLAVGAGFIVFA